MNQHEEHLEVEDTGKEVDREFLLNIRDECLAESEEYSKSEEIKDELEDEESEEELEHEKSEEKLEHGMEDALRRFHDGK